jgi:DNA-binding NtrC family response regulator
VIERACILSDSRMLTEREIQAAMSTGAPRAPSAEAAPGGAASTFQPNLLSTAQREQIIRVLQEVGGNKAAAAKLLGVSRRSLYRWLERLDLKG